MSVNIYTAAGLKKIAGSGFMDAELNENSNNGVKNSVLKEKFDEHDESIAQINTHLSWKLVDTVTGGTRIQLPNDFRELHISMRWGITPNVTSSVMTLNIIREDLTSTPAVFKVGHTANNNSNFAGGFIVSTLSELYMSVLQENNVAQTSSTTVSVYYR